MSFRPIAQQHIKRSFSIATAGGKSGFPSCRAVPKTKVKPNKEKGEESRGEDTEKRKACREVEMNVSPVTS